MAPSVSRTSVDQWSLQRSLAFLAAIFAITFGTLLPAAVAASPALGSPVMLCSGRVVQIVYDEDGRPAPAEDIDSGAMGCAAALLSHLAAVGSPPPTLPKRIEARGVGPQPAVAVPFAPFVRSAPRPPSTAPPRP